MELDNHNTRLIELLELNSMNTRRLDDYGTTIDWMRSWKAQFGGQDLNAFDMAIQKNTAEIIKVNDEIKSMHIQNQKMEDKLASNKAEVLAIIANNNKE